MSTDKTPEETAEELVTEAKAAAAVPTPEPGHAVLPEAPLDPLQVASGAVARYLVETRPEFRSCLSVLIASRQLYAMAMRDMEVSFDALKEEARLKLTQNAISRVEEASVDLSEVKPLEAFALADQVLIQASANAAQQPFEENQLFASFRDTVFPWMMKVTEKHNLAEKEELRKARAEEEQLRVSRNIPLGIRLDGDGTTDLARKRTLVLVGWRPAVLWVLDQITNTVLAARDKQLFHVLRFMSGRKNNASQPNPQLTRLGSQMWEDCARNKSTLVSFLSKEVVPLLSNESLDLWIVDNLAAASPKSLTFSTEVFHANEAHKPLRKMADEIGAGLVCGILSQDKKVESLLGVAWDRLRTHTTVRAVTVHESETQYHIGIGSFAPTFAVNKEVLDTYEGSNIVLA